jgi:hypothetical protein
MEGMKAKHSAPTKLTRAQIESDKEKQATGK